MIAYIEESVYVNGRLIGWKPAYNNILNNGVSLQLDERVVAGQVKREALGPEVKIVGRFNSKPMMNSIMYKVDLYDVQVKDFSNGCHR